MKISPVFRFLFVFLPERAWPPLFLFVRREKQKADAGAGVRFPVQARYFLIPSVASATSPEIVSVMDVPSTSHSASARSRKRSISGIS